MRRVVGRLAWAIMAVGMLAGCGSVSTPGLGPEGAARGMVATGHPLATEAALLTLRQGGNAVDAAVAAALVLGVVDGPNSGIGGGCFMMIRLPDGCMVVLDGRETAPRAAYRDLFRREGQADTSLSQDGVLAVGVPGALAVYDHAVRHYGRRSLGRSLHLAADLAEQGFRVSPAYAKRVSSVARQLRSSASCRAVFFRADGAAVAAGDWLRQPDLASTYRQVARHGIGWFYEGPFAQRAEDWMRAQGGILTAEDFAEYEPEQREPVRSTYRGYDIVGFPPPSSGGVHVAQILHILESFDLQGMGAQSADFVHVVAEAMKLAFADRAHWLGDPGFTPVPRGLISPDYGRVLSRQIRLDRVSTVRGHGTPERAAEDLFSRHTTHFSVADAEGFWVVCTATLNLTFGAKVMVPGTGVILNDQMDDFSVQPGVPNAFGLVGSEANAVAPGKRPLSSMSPTFVMKDGQPILALGAAGGPTIISQVLLVLLYTLDFGMPLDEAVAHVRFHHQWEPDELCLEPGFPDVVRQELQRRGHRIREVDPLGVTQAVAWDAAARLWRGAADPRGEGASGLFVTPSRSAGAGWR